jgi:hypothetical protein
MGCAHLKFYNLAHAMNQTVENSAAHCNEIYEQTVFLIPGQQFIAEIKMKTLTSLHSIGKCVAQYFIPFFSIKFYIKKYMVQFKLFLK